MAAAFVAGSAALATAAVSEQRRSAIVSAVERARGAIVNIHGEKTLPVDEQHQGPTEQIRRVNGMGTGVIIDERGYIVTNHHVVEGVPKINVTLADDTNCIARLVSFDVTTDLAVIKIDAGHDLPVIPVGTSSDLMLGETVIAVGNAYGYSHTVTRGIISALHRSVQVSELQGYDDLIQTDAAINPGNSGGPLLNVDGEMIGVNVAVRAGAQLIGFAIPVDKVMGIATDLLSTRRLKNTWHGVVAKPQSGRTGPGLLVAGIDESSPAATVGLRSGDVIKAVGKQPVARPLDFERALLERKVGEEVQLSVQRDDKPLTLNLVLGSAPERQKPADTAWDLVGLKLEPMPEREFNALGTRFHGGLAVTAVRPDSPAARQGIHRGDVLVGMHVWETVSLDNVGYVLSRPDFYQKLNPVKFYVVRGGETLHGHLLVARRRTD
ncbi:MAG: trypsin-like peptidase domain-containing protein [Planctomycetia bacterium]|nr:trypsin-like peptidase domain-containing protein [Planctomycetia bacterium]